MAQPRVTGDDAVVLRLLFLLPLFLLACESIPGAAQGSYPPARVAMRVEILDESFVRVDGERLARHEFLYRARRDGRLWAKQKLSSPKVILAFDGLTSSAVRDDLITQLRLAGVSKIEFADN